MKNLDFENLKFLAHMGLIYRIFLREYPIIENGGWYLEIDSKADLKSPVLHTKRGEVKIFRSVDSAISEVKKIGFDGPLSIHISNYAS